jgi:hypothetical protein
MGREARCVCTWNGQTSEGKAQLETDQVVFRGDFRLKLALTDLKATAVDGDWLVLATSSGTARLELGPLEAGRWAQAILNPKTIIEKLGIKPGMKVSVLGVRDDSFARLLGSKGAEVSAGKRKSSDAVFVAIEGPADLNKLDGLEAYITRDGAIWTISPKGRKDFNENDIYDHMRDLGLTDVKTARFSDTHTANKFVIPKDRR